WPPRRRGPRVRGRGHARPSARRAPRDVASHLRSRAGLRRSAGVYDPAEGGAMAADRWRAADERDAKSRGRCGVRRWGLGLAWAFVLGGPAASAPGTTPASGGTLRIISPLELGSLDPALSSPGSLMGSLWHGVCATLMSFRDAPAPAGYQVRPEAAA